jgi:hypothetical protein
MEQSNTCILIRLWQEPSFHQTLKTDRIHQKVDYESEDGMALSVYLKFFCTVQ